VATPAAIPEVEIYLETRAFDRTSPISAHSSVADPGMIPEWELLLKTLGLERTPSISTRSPAPTHACQPQLERSAGAAIPQVGVPPDLWMGVAIPEGRFPLTLWIGIAMRKAVFLLERMVRLGGIPELRLSLKGSVGVVIPEGEVPLEVTTAVTILIGMLPLEGPLGAAALLLERVPTGVVAPEHRSSLSPCCAPPRTGRRYIYT